MTDKTPQEIFDDFWKPLVCDQYGCFEPEAIKNELADYHFILGQVPSVYEYVTGGLLSKPDYYASVVINQAEEFTKLTMEYHVQDLYEVIKDCGDLDEALTYIREEYNVN